MTRNLSWLFVLTALCVLSLPASALSVFPPADYRDTPIELGLRDLKAALDKTPRTPEAMRIYVTCPGGRSVAPAKAALKVLPKKAESFAIARVGRDIAILGRDQVGAMYGCFELAERLDMKGRDALDIRNPIVQSPKVEFRAVNPFLTLPYKVEDQDWWFLQDDYWEGYLDLLARARINWMDLHGMFDIKTTWFPNIYPYFVTSEKFPEAGADPAVAKRNLDMLNKVISMAKQRGIKFAIMSYSATWDGPGLRKSPYENTEENLAGYTREVVRKIIESCPDLAMIGFRIGESGKSENFFQNSYIPAIKDAGRPINLYTRTWGARKDRVLGIGKEFPGRFYIEIKYNGEQFGPPYIVAGGRMKGWRDYSYQDYYTYPANYKIIYQLRANGTHRVFPWGSPILAARANEASLLGGAIGLCVEPIDAYYPKYDFRHKDDSPNRWYKWQYERDWFWYQVWGRTGYNPALAGRDDVWSRMFERRFGKAAGKDLYNAMKWASKIVPDAYTSYALGPDHRNHAPELEWGGSVKDWAHREPFDLQNIQSPREYADRLLNHNPSAKATPLEMALLLDEEAQMTRYYLDLARAKATLSSERLGSSPTPEFNDLSAELTALSYLGDYYSHKLIAAAFFAVMEASNDVQGCVYAGADRIREELALAAQAWENLAAIGGDNYKPFVDTLRMHTEEYTHAKEGEKLAGDIEALDQAIAAIEDSGEKGRAPNVWSRGDAAGPSVSRVTSQVLPTKDRNVKTLRVTARIEDPSAVAAVFLKTKSFPSERSWNLTPMNGSGDLYTIEVTVPFEGLMWCIEALDADGNGTMWPDFRRETPYKVVLPWEAPAAKVDPHVSLRSLEKTALCTDDFSAMIVGADAVTLDGAPGEVHSAVLKLVENGLSLLLLTQDPPDKWDGSWVGGDIEFTDADFNTVTFVGDHPILEGVPGKIDLSKIVNDALEGGDSSWTHLSEPKGLAVRTLGEGHVIVMQMGVRHLINDPAVTRLVGNVLKFAKQGSDKPLLVIDPGNRFVFRVLSLHGERYKLLGELAAPSSG